MITAGQFEREYAARSKLSVLELRQHGRVVKRCKCGSSDCVGWQSLTQNTVNDMEQDWKEGFASAPDWIEDAS